MGTLSSVVDAIHGVLDFGVTHFIALFGGLSPVVSLIAISVISGVVLVFIYGKVSFQSKIKNVKRGIHAALLEVILFRHSPILSLKAQGRMLGGGLAYLLLAVPPILILALPCIFLMAQLQGWFGYESLKPGSSTIVRVAVPESAALDKVSLSTDSSVEVVGPLRSLSTHEVLWRVQPTQAGRFPVQVKVADNVSIPSELVVGQSFPRIDSLLSSSWADKLLYPPTSRVQMPKSSVERLEVSYPERSFGVAGFHMHWVVLFLIVSLVGGIVGGRVMKVEL
ncbi:MAG: hypothetical protein J0M12_12350 [Deltaproteobacteria bacterium]|nr:hypothetical protein [Deltaproteobacteria bacterium]